MCKKTDVRKIYNTTDGYFNSRNDIKKPRKIAVIHQRDDKAVAIVKIHSKKNKKGNAFISNVVLKPKKHKSLTEDSIVSNTLIYGRKFDKTKYPIYPTDFVDSNDKLTYYEYKKIKKKVNGDSKQHKITRNNTLKRWKKHFKK